MFGLKLRDEFLTENLEAAVVALHRQDHKGALDIDPQDFLKITYPSIDVQQALNALGKSQSEGRPILLMGEKGRGKSHILSVMHHALRRPDAVKTWIDPWINKGIGEPLKDLRIPEGYIPITLNLNDGSFDGHSFRYLWDVLFDFANRPVGQRYRGRFETTGLNVPDKALILQMLDEEPIALILDELQTWFETTTNSPNAYGSQDRAWAKSFLQILSEIAQAYPQRLLLIASVLDNNNDAFSTINRVTPVLINFQSAGADKDRRNLILHRLFENGNRITPEQKEEATAVYRQERFRLLTMRQDPGGQARSDQEVIDVWPFSPELLRVLEDQILASIRAQGLRDYLRILARIYRAVGADQPVITPANFTIEEVKTDVVSQAIDSLDSTEHNKLYHIAVANFLDTQRAGRTLPYLKQMMGALWMHSYSAARQKGATGPELHLDLTYDQRIDDNAFEAQLLWIVDHAFNLHTHMVGGELHYFLSEDENPPSKLRAAARNNTNFAHGEDHEYIRGLLQSELSPASPASMADVIPLGPNWQRDPWSEVKEHERPERWDKPVLLVLPEVPAHLDGDLGKWLKMYVSVKRNTVRFLLPKAGPSLYSDPEVSINARAAILAEKWGDSAYRKAGENFKHATRKALENRFERFAVLQYWDFQQPERCRFQIKPVREKIGKIAREIDLTLLRECFHPDVFADLVLPLAARQERVAKLLEELYNPPQGAEALVYLGETETAKQLLHLVIKGRLAVQAPDGEWLPLRGSMGENATRERIERVLGKTGSELADIKLGLPHLVGGHAAGPVPSDPPKESRRQTTTTTLNDSEEQAPNLWPESAGTSLYRQSPDPSREFPLDPPLAEASLYYSTGGTTASESTPARAAGPVSLRSEPLLPVNLSPQLEKWGVSANASLPLARLELTNISVADLKRILIKFPPNIRLILEIEKHE